MTVRQSVKGSHLASAGHLPPTWAQVLAGWMGKPLLLTEPGFCKDRPWSSRPQL